MAKFHGEIGYISSVETSPGVWESITDLHECYGDVIRVARRLETSGNLNDNVVLTNSFSIMLDAFASQNFSTIRFIVWMGVRWRVTNVDVQRPRMILTVGEVYNG